MKNMLYLIVSVLIWLLFLASFLFLWLTFVFIWLVSHVIDPKLRLLHRYTGFWGYILTKIIPFWRIKVSGLEQIEKNKQYVICSNHQSMLDILILYRLNMDFKWIAKIELFKIPFFGWVLAMNKYIAIHRGNKNSAVEMYEKAGKAIADGYSIMIFPEGTRSRDGKLGAFKEGAFNLAHHHHLDILPVKIEGAYEALPKGSFIFRKSVRIQLTVMQPIVYTDIKDLTPRETALKTRTLFVKE